VFYDNAEHKKLFQDITDFANQNEIFIYNSFQNVIEMVCRKMFVQTFNRVLDQNESIKNKLQIIIPNTIFIEAKGKTVEQLK